MVHTTTPLNHSDNLSGIGNELAKIAEQTPGSERKEVAEETKKTLSRFAQVFGLTGALALGSSPALAEKSAYEPIVDASGRPPLVLREDTQGKEELFAAFDKNETPEEKLTFNKLSPEYQKKVLNFYRIGKEEQPNEVKLLKGVYNLMYAYDNISIAQQAFIEYNKTGRMPSAQPLGLKSFMRHIKWAFPSAQSTVDMETMTRIDVLIQSMYDTIIAKLKEDTAKLKEDNRILEALIKAL